MSDFDSPWKEALDEFFPQFVELLFPAVHAAVDWSRGHEMLDKELQQLIPEAELGKRLVDKLVKVWFRTGEEAWLLIHVEVQTSPEGGFAERMFVYHYRIFDRYHRPVVSLAVLADDSRTWRPDHYRTDLLGCGVDFRFPVAKLLDWADREALLERSDNPFAQVVLAHLKTLETREQPETRLAWKTRIVRGLYDRGWSAAQVQRMFRMIDWLMDLPETAANLFWQDIQQFKQERNMPFITTPERFGRQEGRQEGRREMLHETIRKLVTKQFGEAGGNLIAAAAAIQDEDCLRDLLDRLIAGASLEEVSALLAATPPQK